MFEHHIHVTLDVNIDAEAPLVNGCIRDVRAWAMTIPLVQNSIVAKRDLLETLRYTRRVVFGSVEDIEDRVKATVLGHNPDVPNAGADFPLSTG